MSFQQQSEEQGDLAQPMAKSKSKSEEEYLRGQIRELKSINKHLQSEVNRLSKRAHLYNEPDNELVMQEEVEQSLPKKQKCPNCNKTDWDSVPLGDTRVMRICYSCGYRRSFKS